MLFLHYPMKNKTGMQLSGLYLEFQNGNKFYPLATDEKIFFIFTSEIKLQYKPK